jgi:hypothetical protein
MILTKPQQMDKYSGKINNIAWPTITQNYFAYRKLPQKSSI